LSYSVHKQTRENNLDQTVAEILMFNIMRCVTAVDDKVDDFKTGFTDFQTVSSELY